MAVLAVALVLVAVQAHAVFISPVTITIRENQSATRITVNNRSDKPRVVNLSWERRTMTKDGKPLKLEDGETHPGYKPADPYIRFSPRQFTLQPYSYQKIRLIVMRPKDMEPGEYRSHLLLQERPVPTNKDGAMVAANGEPVKQAFGGEVRLQVNKATPVYVLQGETDLKLALESAALSTMEGKPSVKFRVVNDSTRTTYAKIEVDCKKSDGTVTTEGVAMLRIYPEADYVDSEKPFKQMDPAQCSSLTLRAMGYKDFEYDGKELARTTL